MKRQVRCTCKRCAIDTHFLIYWSNNIDFTFWSRDLVPHLTLACLGEVISKESDQLASCTGCLASRLVIELGLERAGAARATVNNVFLPECQVNNSQTVLTWSNQYCRLLHGLFSNIPVYLHYRNQFYVYRLRTHNIPDPLHSILLDRPQKPT